MRAQTSVLLQFLFYLSLELLKEKREEQLANLRKEKAAATEKVNCDDQLAKGDEKVAEQHEKKVEEQESEIAKLRVTLEDKVVEDVRLKATEKKMKKIGKGPMA